MITFQQFLEKYNGRFTDFDGYYGFQCMDLMHSYIVEVLGLSDGRILSAPSARDVFINFPNVFGSDYFNKTNNTPTGVPKEGDIMFWVNAPYGHVAIFIEGDANSFRSYDQNYPTNSPCHVQNHTYANVGGWLYPKQTTLPVNVEEQLKQCKELLTGNEEANVSKDKDIANLKLLLTDLTKVNEGLKRSNEIMTVFINEIRKTYSFDTGISLDDMIKNIVQYEKDFQESRKHEKIARTLWDAVKNKTGAVQMYGNDIEGLCRTLQALPTTSQTLKLSDYNLIQLLTEWIKEKYART